MATVKEIKAAIALIRKDGDASQKDEQGIPKFDAIRALVGEASDESIYEALGQKPPEPGNLPQEKPAEEVDGVEIPDPLPPVHTCTHELAVAIVTRAQLRVKSFDADISALDNERAALVERIQQTRDAKDVELRVLEQYQPRVSFAESVKKIQAQTGAQLLKLKTAQRTVATAMVATGQKGYPSALDAAMATRKRSPEQQANLATFIHQNTERQIAERG